MNQTQTRRVQLSAHQEQIKEQFFESGNALMRPIVIALGNVYPFAKRMSNMPSYSEAVAKEYDDRFKTARTFLYEQRNLVNNKYLPRYNVSLGQDDNEATVEMASIIVDGCFDRLYENLCAYAPMLLPPKEAREVLSTLESVYNNEVMRLKNFILPKYKATFKPGVIALEAELAD
jgi:hypothetical protein